MADINHVVLVGRLTKDIELKYTTTGTAIGKISLAVNKIYSKEGVKQEVVSFFDLTAWGKLAENLAPYLKKGQQIGIQGELKQERWVQDGYPRSKVTIQVSTIQLMGGKRKEEGGDSTYEQDEPAPSVDSVTADDFKDDIPF